MVHNLSGVRRLVTLARHRNCNVEILNQDAACLGNCPSDPDETAEAYVMLKLVAQEAESFRLHVDGCEHCQQRVAFHVDYIQAMRDAAASLAGDGVLPRRRPGLLHLRDCFS